MNVNYWNFLNDLQLTNQPYNPMHLTATKREIKVKLDGHDYSQDLESALKKVAGCSTEQSVRCKTFFEDYDRLRKGYVHPSKFVTALDNLKTHLTKDEHEALNAH